MTDRERLDLRIQDLREGVASAGQSAARGQPIGELARRLMSLAVTAIELAALDAATPRGDR